MKRFLETTSETLLLVALLVLFAIPVLVFSGLSPSLKSTTVTQIPRREEQVLGVTTAGEQNYSIELLPSTYDDIQAEELEKVESTYRMRVLVGSAGNMDREDNLIRIVNTLPVSQRVTFSLTDFADEAELDYVKLAFDGTTVEVGQMAAQTKLEPSITLGPSEWVTMKVLVDKNLPSPTTFVLRTDFTPMEE